jgi:hypothetical protein
VDLFFPFTKTLCPSKKEDIFFFGGGVIYTLYKKRNLFLCSSLLRASSWNAKAVSFKEKMPLYLASG